MEPNDGASASVRAEDLRTQLGARREAETMLAAASEVRRAAATQADALVEEAQKLSAQLVAESRVEADQVTLEAHELSERLVARARAEAEDITRQARTAADEVRERAAADVENHRGRVRAEVTALISQELAEANRLELERQHERQEAMVGDLEASVRILGVSLESAAANVAELLGSLDDLRTHSADALQDSQDPAAATSTEPTTEPTAEPTTDQDDPADGEVDDARSRPAMDDLFRVTAEPADQAEISGSEMFDSPGPGSSVPPATPVYDVEVVEVEVDHADELDELAAPTRPLSATEAFLQSAHIDHGDPPLPPVDDADVGERYARDAMRATARAHARQVDDLEVGPERPSPPRRGRDERGVREDADERDRDSAPTGKPLGWLFRS